MEDEEEKKMEEGESSKAEDMEDNVELPYNPRLFDLKGHSGPIYGVAISPDENFVLTSSFDATSIYIYIIYIYIVRLWSICARRNIVIYRGHNFPIWTVKFGLLGCYFITSSNDKTAKIWTTKSVAPVRMLVGHLADVEVYYILYHSVDS